LSRRRSSLHQRYGIGTLRRPNICCTALSILFVLNLLLGTFNLLPVPPLDGHAGIMLFMGEDTAHHYLDWVHQSGYAMLGLIVAWYAFDRIFG